MHKTNWDDLRIALAVADAGSVNAAAQRLGINHATVLRRLTAFEERHGLSLFQKSPSGYRVDPAAQSVVDTLRGIDRSVDAFERAVSGFDEKPSGNVRVTSTDSLCVAILPPALSEISVAFPDLKVSVVSTNAHLNLSKLDADLTIRPAAALPADLKGHRICSMGFSAYATPDYLARHPVPQHWIGVAEHLLRSPAGAWLDSSAREKVVMTADSFVSLHALACTGMGAAVIPCFLADNDPRLVRVSTLQLHLRTGLWIASHPDVAPVPRVRAITDHLIERLSPMRTLIEGD